MRIALDQADFAELAGHWEAVYGARFRVSPDLLRMKTLGCPTYEPAYSYAEPGQGFVAVKRSSSELYPGPDPSRWHLCALAGTAEFIGRALAELGRVPAGSLAFGQDSSHLLPGCPLESPMGLALRSAGFIPSGVEVDLERDLGDFTYDSRFDPPTGVELRWVEQRDVPDLEAFLAQEFPGRWRHDVMSKIEVEGRSDMVMGLFVGGRCEGFALTQQEGCLAPIGGAVWLADLGPSWGSLGPIGVSQAVRGMKLGGAVLHHGLWGLHQRGARQTIIDWTTLVEFYGREGFVPTRRYETLVLPLASAASR